MKTSFHSLLPRVVRWTVRTSLLFVLWDIGVAAAQRRPPATSPVPGSFDVTEKTIPELQEALRGGTVTSRQLVEAYLARIAAYDRKGPRLNAIVALNPKALQDADALDQDRSRGAIRGPLHGIPVLVKDNFETAGMPTAAGSLALATFDPGTDAFQVKRLREAGAVIFGKTNMHELASGITSISSVAGQTRNPYDLSRNPGGSSGGTGAAVAASFAAAGMGSDTCGSIRIPASHNNLVGLRGTRGLSSRAGIVPLSSTQDIGGPIARTLIDLAIMLDATVGRDLADPVTIRSEGKIPASYVDALKPGGLKGTRVGMLKSLFGSATEDEEASGIVKKAVDVLTKEGAEAVDVAVPGLDDLLRDSSVINSEFKFDLAEYLAARPGAPVRSIAEILDRGLYDEALEGSLKRRNAVEVRDTDAYRRALVKREALRNAVTSAMEESRVIALVYPTMRRKPARIGEVQPGTNCQLSASSGLPALSAPAGFTADGLPIGIELLGREFSEADLLRIAYGLEQTAKLRKAPFSTPPLVAGKAPAPVTFGAQGDALRVRLTYDPTTAELRYMANIAGVPAERVRLAALHRGEPEKSGALLFRLIEAGEIAGQGSVMLGAQAREDLSAGRLYLQLYTLDHPAGTSRVRVMLPS